MENTICNLLDNLTVFAANGTGSPEQIEAYGFGIRGLEQGARVATVKLAIGCLRRYANGDRQKFFASGDDQRLKNYYSVFNGLVAEGYAPATQLAWFGKVEGNFSAVYGQSKKAAIAALQEAGVLKKPAPAAGAPAAGGEITVALSEADRAGNIAAELIGQMSPAVFDLLAAAVAQRMASDTAAQQRRDAAAAERQAAADTAAAAKAKQAEADKTAAHLAELRRAADAADLAAIAADQAAKLPDATAAAKKRAAKLLKAAQAAGGAYLAAAAAHKTAAA